MSIGANIFDQGQVQDKVINIPNEGLQEEEKERKWKDEFLQIGKEVSAEDVRSDLMYMCFSGCIESICQTGADTKQIKISLEFGPDWTLISGQQTNFTQEASNHNCLNNDIIFNFPFEFVFSTTNIQGWPQLVFQIFSHDLIGRSVIQAYGMHHLPLQSGHHSPTVRLFKPLPVSRFSGFMGYFKGIQVQIIKPQKTIAHADGRELMRCKHAGILKFNVDLLQFNMEKHGFKSNYIPK